MCCRRSIEAAAQETALNWRFLFAVVTRLNGCQLMPYRGGRQALRESATLCCQRAGGEAGADTGMGRTGVSGLLCWVNTPAMACQEDEPGLVGPRIGAAETPWPVKAMDARQPPHCGALRTCSKSFMSVRSSWDDEELPDRKSVV